MQEKKPAGADLNMSGEYNHQNRWGTERSKIQLSQSLGKKIKGTRCPGNEEYQKVSKQTDRHSLHVRNNALMSCNEKEKSKAKEIKWSKKSSQRHKHTYTLRGGRWEEKETENFHFIVK